MDLELDRLIDVFRTETAENLGEMEQALLVMEAQGVAVPELMNAVLRAAHTVKGNSAMVGFEDVMAAAHALEDDLERMRDGSLAFSSSLVTTLLEGVDSIRALMAIRREDGHEGRPYAGPTNDVRRTSLRVDTARLDTLLDLTGEITIARGRLSQLVGGGDSVLATTLWQLEQLHAALQGEVMALRMVPLGPMLEAQQRSVRDVALKVGKQVAVVIEGRDVEVDTSIAEQMRDPLTHMVRNAVDHGIESAAARVLAGKPAQGTITLKASHQSGMVSIELSDDGAGLDRERIAAKAVAVGLIADAASLSDQQVFALIFEPGFSTAAELTEVSGRGVGMDVVRKSVEALRGSIEIDSVRGTGTTFTIRLPLTVAIISGFTVGVGDERYVLPLESVEECLNYTGESLLSLRGKPLPCLWLGAVLRAGTGPAPTTSSRASVVVVRHGDRRIGLVVDVLDGDCQAVIKPLDGALRRLPGISGSTILGNGRVALILNVAQLVEYGRNN